VDQARSPGRPFDVFTAQTTTIPGRRTFLPPYDRGPDVQIRRTRVGHAHRRPLGAHKGTWATRTRAICGRTFIPTPIPGTGSRKRR